MTKRKSTVSAAAAGQNASTRAASGLQLRSPNATRAGKVTIKAARAEARLTLAPTYLDTLAGGAAGSGAPSVAGVGAPTTATSLRVSSVRPTAADAGSHPSHHGCLAPANDSTASRPGNATPSALAAAARVSGGERTAWKTASRASGATSKKKVGPGLSVVLSSLTDGNVVPASQKQPAPPPLTASPATLLGFAPQHLRNSSHVLNDPSDPTATTGRSPDSGAGATAAGDRRASQPLTPYALIAVAAAMPAATAVATQWLQRVQLPPEAVAALRPPSPATPPHSVDVAASDVSSVSDDDDGATGQDHARS